MSDPKSEDWSADPFYGADSGVETPRILTVMIEGLRKEVSEIRGALVQLTDAVTRLAVIEDRQLTTARSLERAFESIAEIQHRLIEIEKQIPQISHDTDRTGVWVDRLVWSGLSGAAVWLAKSAGIF